MADTESTPPIVRSERFIIFHQLDALCESLQFLIDRSQEPGDSSLELLFQLKLQLQNIAFGPCFETLPDIPAAAGLAEQLVHANNLRAVSIAFLTPEEREESMKFGFAP